MPTAVCMAENQQVSGSAPAKCSPRVQAATRHPKWRKCYRNRKPSDSARGPQPSRASICPSAAGAPPSRQSLRRGSVLPGRQHIKPFCQTQRSLHMPSYGSSSDHCKSLAGQPVQSEVTAHTSLTAFFGSNRLRRKINSRSSRRTKNPQNFRQSALHVDKARFALLKRALSVI